MTPADIYREALEAAAKACEHEATLWTTSEPKGFEPDDVSGARSACFNAGAAIRALPNPYSDDMVLVPKGVFLAITVLLNHVEPGWENCKFVVAQWLAAAKGKS